MMANSVNNFLHAFLAFYVTSPERTVMGQIYRTTSFHLSNNSKTVTQRYPILLFRSRVESCDCEGTLI